MESVTVWTGALYLSPRLQAPRYKIIAYKHKIMNELNIPNIIVVPRKSGLARHGSLSSVDSMAMTPMTASMPSSVDDLRVLGVEASPHEVLLFNPELEISFPIVSVIQIAHPSPVRGSGANIFSEMRVRIGAAGRASYIQA